MADKTKAKVAGGLGMGAVASMIAAVIAIEGGYVNHPNDRGGETNMGITKRVAVENGYAGPMRALPRDVAESIYYRRYLVAPGFDALIPLDAAVTEELFDTAVNMGPARPARWLQLGINGICPASKLTVDGRVGRGTVSAFARCQKTVGARQLCVRMLDGLDAAQKARYTAIVQANPSQRVFYKGWVAHRIGNVDRAKCGRAA